MLTRIYTLPGAKLKEQNDENLLKFYRKAYDNLAADNQKLRDRLSKYEDLSTPDNVHVLSACAKGIEQDLDLAS